MSYTFNDDAISLVDSNLNQLAVSQSQTITNVSQSGFIQMGVSGTSALSIKVDSQGNQIVTGSFTVNNFPVTQSVKLDQTITLPVSISNFPTVQQVTGTITVNNPTILPTTQSVKIDQSITLPVSVSNLITITGSVTQNNFPVTQSIKLVDIGTNITQSVTGSVTVNNLTFVSGGNLSIFITASNILPVTGTITINNPVTTLTANQGVSGTTSWLVTGSIFQINQPITQSVKIDQAITLPVSISNNTTSLFQDRNGSGTINSLNGTVAMNTQGCSVVSVNISGTWTAILSFEGTTDGTNWFSVVVFTINALPSFGATIASNVPVNISCGGYSQVRVRASAFTSGIINVFWNASNGINQNTFSQITDGAFGPAAVKGSSTAAVAADKALVVAVSPNNTVSIITGSNTLSVATIDGVKATYSSVVVGFAAAATPTDVFTIIGSATKTIRVTRIAFIASQTLAAQRDISIIKRSAANTGGTSTVLTNIPHDSTSSAATAVVRSYTANPTGLGAAVGTIRSRKVFVAATGGNSDEFIVEFGIRNSQGIVLRGVAETLSVNLNSVTSGGNSITISIEWTEE